MNTNTGSVDRNDPLYFLARQSVLARRDTRIAALQRDLRIGYRYAFALLEAMRGDIFDDCETTVGWRFYAGTHRESEHILQDKLRQAAEWIRHAQGLVIAAGPGMGIDSGLPDFRDDEVFRRIFPRLEKRGLQFEQIASPEGFQQHPAMAWGFYGHRLNLYRVTAPHDGFERLKQWSQRMPHGCFVFTNTVDGHFHKAGFPSARIYECQGSIHWLQCAANCSGQTWPAVGLDLQVDAATCRLEGELPRCPYCGELARPNLLMADDWCWNARRSDLQRSLLDGWLDRTSAPLVLEIGASRGLTAVRQFSRRMQRRGSRLVRIHLDDERDHDPKAMEISLGVSEALQRIQGFLI